MIILCCLCYYNMFPKNVCLTSFATLEVARTSYFEVLTQYIFRGNYNIWVSCGWHNTHRGTCCSFKSSET